MSPNQQIQNFAQSVYLIIKSRYYGNIDGPNGQVFVSQIIDFANQYLDELETEINPDGSPVDWVWSRQYAVPLGTATTGAASIPLISGINNLLTDETRYVQILQDGTPVSNWAVVGAADITNVANRITEDMCTVVGGNIVFSRQFRDTENGGQIIGDVTAPLPRMSATNAKVLSIVKPKQLLILGVAKNASLPDIVQGKLSPSFVQRYNDLLTNAIARNNASARSDTAVSENYSYISGIGF